MRCFDTEPRGQSQKMKAKVKRWSKHTERIQQRFARKVKRFAVLANRAAQDLRRFVGQFELVLLHFRKLAFKLFPGSLQGEKSNVSRVSMAGLSYADRAIPFHYVAAAQPLQLDELSCKGIVLKVLQIRRRDERVQVVIVRLELAPKLGGLLGVGMGGADDHASLGATAKTNRARKGGVPRTTTTRVAFSFP
jgi:hypothetical protein